MDNNVKKPSGGQFKCFKNAENQALWDKYFAHKLEEVQNSGKQLKTDPKISIAQYKPGLLTLEKLTGKAFSDITVEDLEQLDGFYQVNQGKNMPYVKAFFITAITQKWLRLNNAELALYLVSVEYKGLVEALIEQAVTINNLAV